MQENSKANIPFNASTIKQVIPYPLKNKKGVPIKSNKATNGLSSPRHLNKLISPSIENKSNGKNITTI